MKRFKIKPYRWSIFMSILLVGFSIYVLLDTFVIPKTYQIVTDSTTQSGLGTQSGISSQLDSSTTSVNSSQEQTQVQNQSNAIITDHSYQDENMKISINTVQQYNSTIYIADIQVSDASYLKTALAGNTYGRNIKATTSSIANANNAIFAINGDYYGFRNNGFVLRNGTLYRTTARSSSDDSALVINNVGDFSIIHESKVSASSLSNNWQILSFGPTLIENGQIMVTSFSEVSQSMSSNPRTAIGQVSALHYIVVVSDGRTSSSAGLSLLQLAQVMKNQGCTTAYNLDGGGSSTMYFNGKVVNNPTDGRTISEREVSDIVYFGY